MATEKTLDLDQGLIATVYDPYVHRRLAPGDAELTQTLARLRREWFRRRWLGALRSLAGRIRRTPERVKANYEDIWDSFRFEHLDPDKPRKLYLTEWRGEYQMVNAWGIPRVHLACLERLIEAFAPRRVLEVGCGRGLNLAVLSARFPDVEFTGLELSESGARAARALAEAPELPPALVRFAPFALPADGAAPRSVDVRQGSAEKLPFADGAFDLVYTRQALEQMEFIREPVMREIRRVSADHVAMFEAFRDWNRTGMCRDRVVATGYFAAWLNDLPRYGLHVIHTAPELPHKVYMRVGLAVTRIED